MTKRNWLAVSISAVILAIIGFLLSAIHLFCMYYYDEALRELLFKTRSTVFVLVVSSGGILFLPAEMLFSRILKKRLSKIEVKTAQLLGTVLYVILILFLFPELLSLKIYYIYLPRRELAPQWTVFLSQTSSFIASFFIIVFNLGILHNLRRKERKTLENRT